VFNPFKLGVLVQPVQQVKLIPELTVVLPHSLYRFQGSLLASRSASGAFRSALDYNITIIPNCQHLFSNIFHFFSNFFSCPKILWFMAEEHTTNTKFTAKIPSLLTGKQPHNSNG